MYLDTQSFVHLKEVPDVSVLGIWTLLHFLFTELPKLLPWQWLLQGVGSLQQCVLGHHLADVNTPGCCRTMGVPEGHQLATKLGWKRGREEERERGREGEREKGREGERERGRVLRKGTLATIFLKRSLPTSRTVLHVTKTFPWLA